MAVGGTGKDGCRVPDVQFGERGESLELPNEHVSCRQALFYLGCSNQAADIPTRRSASSLCYINYLLERSLGAIGFPPCLGFELFQPLGCSSAINVLSIVVPPACQHGHIVARSYPEGRFPPDMFSFRARRGSNTDSMRVLVPTMIRASPFIPGRMGFPSARPAGASSGRVEKARNSLRPSTVTVPGLTHLTKPRRIPYLWYGYAVNKSFTGCPWLTLAMDFSGNPDFGVERSLCACNLTQTLPMQDHITRVVTCQVENDPLVRRGDLEL